MSIEFSKNPLIIITSSTTISKKLLVLGMVGICALISCWKEFDYGKSKKAVETLKVSSVSQTTATVAGKVITDNGSLITERGICYNTSNNPTVNNLKKKDSQSILGEFFCSLNALLPSTKYYVRAYASNNFGTAYGAEVTFTTLDATIPILASTTKATLVTTTTAQTGGVISYSGTYSVTNRGVCYSTIETLPAISGSKTNDGIGIGTFISTLTNLSPNSTYYVRAYATNSIGTGYGEVQTLHTSAASIPNGITTMTLTSITQTTASGGGIITGDGGAPITTRGICWSNLTASPTISDARTMDGNGIGSYNSTIAGLKSGTSYYVRAYATNIVGTAYGPVKACTTTSSGTIPTGVTTTSISSILQTTASSGGSISSDGGTPITSRGVCWSNTTASPTIANAKTINGTGIGTFTSLISGLLPATTYYVRAYATNANGTAYGPVLNFSTQPNITVPFGITTSLMSSITQTSALGGGSITDDGGSTISARGVCWSNSISPPTISNNTTNNGNGIGSFTSSIFGLTTGITYYVRAYATNNVGTGYGNVITFTTLSLMVGQSYQGGVIAYIFQPGDTYYKAGETHGLIVTTSVQSTAAQWGCSGTSISTSTTIGTGQNNTTAIVNNCTIPNIAAHLCDNLNFGGYSDWFLPSRDELSQLFINRNSIGVLSIGTYWSSSQNASSTAWSVNFMSGAVVSSNKTSALYVRAVRRF